jgi:acetolactate synthase-1/2/3 large subunit
VADLNGGHLVARTLRQAGVGHVFTLCGGHILPIYDGCITEGVQVVDMRHEQACAHAADAYARLTRNIGVALVTAGPGVTDAVTGIANAYSARSPVLLIGGAAPLGLRGLGSLQEVEQVDLLRPITKGSWTVSETPAGAGLRRDPGRPVDDHGRGSDGADPDRLRSPAAHCPR